MTTLDPYYTAGAIASNSNEIPLKSYLQNRDRANSRPEMTELSTRRHSSGLAAAAAMTALSRHPSKSEKSPPPLSVSTNKYYSSRQNPLTPPMSPIRASELAMRSPTKPGRPSERPYGMEAQLPSPPRQESNGSELASQYPAEKKNMIFPKTLRHPPSEPDVPPTEPPPPTHVPLSSRTLREPRPAHQVSEPNATTSSYMHLPTQMAPQPPPRSPPELQNYSVPPKGHIPLSSKTLRRPPAQPQPQPQQRNQMPQAPSTTHIPLSSRTLRRPSREQKGSMSIFRISMRPSQRERPPVRSMQSTAPAPPESIPMEGRTGPRTKVQTDVRRSQLPAVTHEHIKPSIHHINNEQYTREIHNHDVFHRVLPVKETETLPPKHYAPSPTEPGKLVEIAAPAAPISMAMASHTTCAKDVSTNRASPVDKVPVTARPQPKSFPDAHPGARRHLVRETTVIAPDGTVRTESVWRYKPTTESAAHDETEITPLPPRVNWEKEAALAKEDNGFSAQPARPRTPRKGDVLAGSRERKSPAGANFNTDIDMPRPTPTTEDAAIIAANAALEQEIRRPSVASEWNQVQKRAARPVTKTRTGAAGDKEGTAAGKHFETARKGKRVSQEAETEGEPMNQRPGRPAPSSVTPSSKTQSTFLSNILPEKTMHEGTPQPPGQFGERGSASEYGSASSELSPSPDLKQARFKNEAYGPEGKLVAGIWQRHSLVIPAGIVKGGKALMGPGQLMEGPEKEQELSMHRLKKASKPEAERVKAHETMPPLTQNELEAAKLERHKTEELEREKMQMGNIQRMVGGNLDADEAGSYADKIAVQKAAEKLREEAQSDEIEEQIQANLRADREPFETQKLESELHACARRRSNLLRAAEHEHEKAPVLHNEKRVAARRRRSSLLRMADNEQKKALRLEAEKREAQAQEEDQGEVRAAQDLEMAYEETVAAQQDREEELSVQRFLAGEVERQRKEDLGTLGEQRGLAEGGDAFVEGHRTWPVGNEREMADMPVSEVLEPAGEKKVKHHSTFPVSSTENGGSKKTKTAERLQRGPSPAEVPLPDTPVDREVTPRGRRQLSWAEVAGERV